jgi:NADH-quinone oxidoreductase subunit C
MVNTAGELNPLRAGIAAFALSEARCLAPVVREQEVVDVDPAEWLACAQALRSAGAEYLDLLTAYVHQEELDVVLHVGTADLAHRLLVRTHVTASQLPSLTDVFPGADWHERETAEMFGLEFMGHPNPARLLLNEDFQGYPLLKSFALTPRVALPWPGEVEPGGARMRRKTLPPGVPVEWTAT